MVDPGLTPTALRSILDRLDGIAILDGVLRSAASTAMIALLRLLADEGAGERDILLAFGTVFAALAIEAQRSAIPELQDAWQAHLIVELVEDVNPWSYQAEHLGRDGVSAPLRARAAGELRLIKSLFELSAPDIAALAAARFATSELVLLGMWEPWQGLAASTCSPGTIPAFDELCRSIARLSDWGDLTDLLESYWYVHGAGEVSRFRSLHWQGVELGLGRIEHPDPIRMSGLFGYDRQHRLLRENVERFLAGLPAQDVLLYGRPGTGKSSTVKALANEYADRGARLVELPKEAVGDLLTIVKQLRHRGAHYLLFIDDLSFEEDETEFKALKVLLEGTAEARPANILVHATTNRLNLIREQFKDRGNQRDDVHWRDTMDEKVALGHRFGLRLTFDVPSVEGYLAIAIGLARERGIAMADEEIRSRALRWANRHQNTRSGRLARQFADDLEAEVRQGLSNPKRS